jgi:hypothetical protein
VLAAKESTALSNQPDHGVELGHLFGYRLLVDDRLRVLPGASSPEFPEVNIARLAKPVRSGSDLLCAPASSFLRPCGQA